MMREGYRLSYSALDSRRNSGLMREQRSHHRPGAELSAENQYGGNHQRHVEHIAESTDLDRRENIMQYDAGAIDSARNEIVRIDKKNET